jgi:transmembrane sensor
MGPELMVTLLRGHVVVLPQNATVRPFRAPAPGTSGPSSSQMADIAVTGIPPDWSRIALDPGEQLVVAAGAAPRVSRVNVRRVTAWERGEVVFEDERLAEVVQRMNRYLDEPIVVSGARAADLRISGVFREDDVDGFVSTILSYLPLKARQRADGTVVLSYREDSASRVRSPP